MSEPKLPVQEEPSRDPAAAQPLPLPLRAAAEVRPIKREWQGEGQGGRQDGWVAPEPATVVGSTIDGRYRIDSLLAVGGMGSVYQAEQVFIGRQVALKILHPNFAASPELVERFQREAQIAVQLRSPHVVDVLDFGRTADGRFYLTMELLEGESLEALLRREKRLAAPRVVHLLRQLLHGLVSAHRAGIVHRDLKPENLWLTPTPEGPQLKILDFGIAKLIEPPAGAAKTQLGLVMGTPEYLAPEQAMGLAVDERADLYSVGMIAYVLLIGAHPFDTSDLHALVRAQATAPVPPLTDAAPQLSAYPRLVEFTAKATAKTVAARVQTAAELLALLEGAEFPIPSENPASERSPPPSNPSGAPRATLAGPPLTENLAIMFTDIVGFTAKTSRQSREENAQMLAQHDKLMLPVLRTFGGRKVKSIGDALLVTFKSPTDSVLCGMTLQDQLARYNQDLPEDQQIIIRVAINIGEVRIERGDVFGEPVNIAARVEGETPAGEVWFTEAVYLAMNKSEIPTTEIGKRPLRGIPEPVRLYGVQRSLRGLPFGGAQLSRVDGQVDLAGAVAEQFREGVHFLAQHGQGVFHAGETFLRASRRRALLIAAGSALGLLVLSVWLAMSFSFANRAERALRSGQAAQLLRELDQGKDDSAEALYLRARALHLLNRPEEGLSFYLAAAAKNEAVLRHPEVYADLVQDLGGARFKEAADALVALGDPAVDELDKAAADSKSHRRRWAAIEALKRLKRDDNIDLGAAYLADLSVEDCDTVSRAARKLAELDDTRAIAPLQKIAQRKTLFLESCEAQAARAALRKLEGKKTP